MNKSKFIVTASGLLLVGFTLTACTNTEETQKSSEENIEAQEINNESATSLSGSLEEFNAIYKNALFDTGKNKDTALSNTEDTLASWEGIESLYLKSQPGEYLNTENWEEKMTGIGDYVRNAQKLSSEGDNTAAHEELEHVRKELKLIRGENGIANISDDMLELHDSMEVLVEEETYNQDLIDETRDYAVVLEKYIEENGEYKDMLSDFNKKLDTLEENSDDEDKYKENLGEVKSSFIEMYLKFG